MRISRKLMLLALTALAALAFASSANAQSVTVTDEASTVPCSDVALDADHNVTGGCAVNVVSEQETQIVAGTAGGPVVISTCEDQFEAHIDGGGEGYIDVVTTTGHAAAPCTREACDEAAPSHATIPWRIHLREPEGAPLSANVAFCLYNQVSAEGTIGTPCVVNIPVTQTVHSQSFNAEGGQSCANLPPGAVTVVGHWHAAPDAGHPAIEVSH